MYDADIAYVMHIRSNSDAYRTFDWEDIFIEFTHMKELSLELSPTSFYKT